LVTNSGGCKDSTIRCIDVDPQFVIFIPNAFTPNGDGDNDVFYAKGEYINDFEMRIFDRWGNMIYYADNITKPWNGKKNNVGEVQQQDVYVYQITIKDNKEKRHKYVGTVTLVNGG
jgi:gliding motility-associated-like protein